VARLSKAERDSIEAAKAEARAYREFVEAEFQRWFTQGRPLSDWYGRELRWGVRGRWSATKGRR